MLLSALFASSNEEDDRFWGGATSIDTASGVKVTSDSAMRHTAVYACVRLLSETLASLPLEVYRRLPNDKGKEVLYDHPLRQLLHYQPNDYQSSFEWREMMQGHIGLRGNCYSKKIIDNRGQIISLDPLHTNRVTPEWNENNRIVYRVKEPLDKHGLGFKEKIYTSEEIFHVRGLSVDGLTGLNPIEHHRETVGVGMAAQEYGARFFSNDATPRGVLEMTGSFKNDEDFNTFRRRWAASQAGVNRHKTAVLEDGMKYVDIGMTNEDAQFIDTKKLNITDIARIFNIPPHMIGDLEKATFSNISDQAIQFVVHTMRPWLVRWEQAFKRDMIIEEDVFVEFNVDALLRGDPKARAEYYNKGVMGGWLVRNEVRRKENLNPLDGLDEPLTPLNMVEEKEIKDGEEEDEDNKEEKKGDDIRERSVREEELEDKAAERIARKEHKILTNGAYDFKTFSQAAGNHLVFIESVLAVDSEVAQQAIDDLEALYDKDILISDFMTIRKARLIKIARKQNV